MEVTDFLFFFFFPIPFNKKHQPLFTEKLQYSREKVRTGCVENGHAAVNRMKRSLLSRTCYLSCRKVAFYLQWRLQDVDLQDTSAASWDVVCGQRLGPEWLTVGSADQAATCFV